MSGIYCYFNPQGLSPETRTRFADRLKTRASRLQGRPVEEIGGDLFQGASIHHGVVPSGGVASRRDEALICTGSCWTMPEDTQFASTEKILDRWARESRRGKPVLGGTYAIARCSDSARELTVESDRFGGLPIYYRDLGDCFAVATEMKFLLAAGRDSVDLDSLGEMMSFGYLSRGNTLLSGVHLLKANQRLVINESGWSVESCPTPGYSRNRALDDDAIDEYDSIVQRYLNRFKPVAPAFSISLSGGLDSRLIAMAAQRAGIPMHAFTIGEKGSLDAAVAEQLAGAMGIPMTPYEVRGQTMAQYFHRMVWFTEGRVPANHMHYVAANFGRILPPGPQLHGLIGETHLGGPFDNVNLLESGPEEIRKVCGSYVNPMIYWPAGFPAEVLTPRLAEGIAGARQMVMDSLFAEMDFKGSYEDLLEFKLRYRVLGFSIPCLNSQVLPWTDLASPFLDCDAFDFGATIKAGDVEDRRGQIAWGLRKMPAVADLPRIKDGVQIPVTDDDPEAFNRGIRNLERQIKLTHYICRLSRGRINPPFKRSFPVYGQWYRRFRPVRQYVDGILLSDQCLERGLFRPEGVKRLLHHLRTGHNIWNAVGSLLMAEIFIRQFVDGCEIPEDSITPLDPGS